MYSTVEKIKSEAGFENNPNMTDEKVGEQQTSAYAVVQSTISTMYDTNKLQVENADFDGSPAQAYLEHLERILGASYLLNAQYAVNSMGGTLEQAKDLYDQARSKLNDIASGRARLFDKNGKEFPRLGTSVSGPVISKSRCRGREFYPGRKV